MHVRNFAPETFEAGHSLPVTAMRPSTFLVRGASRRVLIVTLAAAALIAVSAAVLVRLGQDEAQTLANQPAPAEPGLFEFPSRQEMPQTAAAPAAPVPQAGPGSPSAPLPRSASTVAVKPPALPTGVERYDSCRPACDSRDPALSGAPPAGAPPRVASDVPLPPRGIGEGVPAKAEPGLIDRTVTATRTAVSDVTGQMKSVFGIK